MKKKVIILAVIVICLFAGIAIGVMCAGKGSDMPPELKEADIKKGSVHAGASLHDPMVIKGKDGKYYMYGTHMTAAVSDDLKVWNSFGDGVDEKNPIFDNLLVEPFAAFGYVGRNDERWYSVWAPSIIYNKAMDKYMMYFATTSSYIVSNICFATADNIEGPYTYQDTILYSGFAKPTARKTNFYDIMGEDKMTFMRYSMAAGYINSMWPNCIDPALFYDEEERLWMVYGSWSGGIFLLEIDEKTGQIIHPETDDEKGIDKYYGKHLIGGNHHAVEGAHIEYDKENGYYYLFVSYGNLTSNGGYQIRVFRSETVDGTYVDAQGKTLGGEKAIEKFGVKLMGNYTLPSLDVTYMAPGGQSAFTDEDGKMYVVYHQRFADGTEYHEPRVHQLFLNEEDWPVAAPFATQGETLSETGYKQTDLTGTFYLLNHGSAVDDAVNTSKKAVFEKGKITGEVSGTYSVTDGSNFAQITVDGVTYKGVLVEMEDEAGNATLCFSGVGDNNQSLWGVHYMEQISQE